MEKSGQPHETPVSARESEEKDDNKNEIQIGYKKLNVTLDLSGRGIVLIYALAFAIVIISIGWAAIQFMTAWKLTLTPVGPALGFCLWASIAFISALVSH